MLIGALKTLKDRGNSVLLVEHDEAALRAADGHLEWNAPEEAFGELRRAQVQVETLAWLAQRII